MYRQGVRIRKATERSPLTAVSAPASFALLPLFFCLFPSFFADYKTGFCTKKRRSDCAIGPALFLLCQGLSRRREGGGTASFEAEERGGFALYLDELPVQRRAGEAVVLIDQLQ